jgi:hypothetical protein
MPLNPEQLKEMLSVFEPSDLIYREGFDEQFDPPSERMRARSDRYEQFGQVLVAETSANPSLGWKIGRIISPAFITKDFFEKELNRSRRIFECFDAFADKGPTIANDAWDYPHTVARLKELVSKIGAGCELYISPHANWTEEMQRAVDAAVIVLLEILDCVVARNSNAYAAKPWTQTDPSARDPNRNNLYVDLIRFTSPAGPHDLFVLSVLHNLLQKVPFTSALRDKRELLEKLYRQVETFGAPQLFLNELDAIVRSARKRTPPDPAGGSSSRARHQ